MRVRRLQFDNNDASRERFLVIWNGFLIGGNQPQAKGIEVVRREARMLGKLEDIGYVDSGRGQNDGEAVVVLHAPPKTMTLEEPEFDMLRRYIEATPWSVAFSRKIVNTVDWLDAIPQTDGG